MFRENSNPHLRAAPIDPALRLPDVIRATGLGRSSIFAAIRAHRFPSPIKLSTRAVGWRVSQIQAWLDSRDSARNLGGEA